MLQLLTLTVHKSLFSGLFLNQSIIMTLASCSAIPIILSTKRESHYNQLSRLRSVMAGDRNQDLPLIRRMLQLLGHSGDPFKRTKALETMQEKNMSVTSIIIFNLKLYFQAFQRQIPLFGPYMACNLQKGTFAHLHKVSFQISLCSRHRLIRNVTFHFIYFFLF